MGIPPSSSDERHELEIAGPRGHWVAFLSRFRDCFWAFIQIRTDGNLGNGGRRTEQYSSAPGLQASIFLGNTDVVQAQGQKPLGSSGSTNCLKLVELRMPCSFLDEVENKTRCELQRRLNVVV